MGKKIKVKGKLRVGSFGVMPFTSKKKQLAFAKKARKKYKTVGTAKSKGIYWVAAKNKIRGMKSMDDDFI